MAITGSPFRTIIKFLYSTLKGLHLVWYSAGVVHHRTCETTQFITTKPRYRKLRANCENQRRAFPLQVSTKDLAKQWKKKNTFRQKSMPPQIRSSNSFGQMSLFRSCQRYKTWLGCWLRPANHCRAYSNLYTAARGVERVHFSSYYPNI